MLIFFIASSLAAATDVWKNTVAPRSRDILFSLPANQRNSSLLNLTLFANRQTRMGFPFRDNLNAEPFNQYLNLLLIPNYSSPTARASEVNDLSTLFNQLSFQEHKIGGVLSTSIPCPYDLAVDIELPFYVSLRNFWLSRQTIKTIKQLINPPSTRSNRLHRSPRTRSGPLDQGTQQPLTRSGLTESKKRFTHIGSKGGLSDARLRVTWKKTWDNKVQLAVGPELIVPLSALFNRERPLLNSYKILTTDITPLSLDELLTEVRQLGLRPNLGNEGHWGYGAYSSLKLPIHATPFELWAMLRYTFFAPAQHFRFIPVANAAPAEFYVHNNPGSIFQSRIGIDYALGKAKLSLGYDFFMQQRESIFKQQNFSQIASEFLTQQGIVITPDEVQPTFAERPRALQHSLCAQAGYTFDCGRVAITPLCGGELSLGSQSMGKNYSVMLGLGVSF